MPFAIRRVPVLVSCLAGLMTLTPEGALAQTKPIVTSLQGDPVRSVLWVGNSFFYYNNSMHNHFGALARSVDPKNEIRSVSVTISGSGIDWHDVRSYFAPNRIGRYTVGADKKLSFNPPGRQFDTAIFMDCAQCPVHPELGEAFQAGANDAAVVTKQNGARPVFFMSWGYKDQAGMTAQVAEKYTKVGNDNGALVVPAGLAFERSMAARPALELYQQDKRHPTLAGTYLAAATVYVTLTGKDIMGAGYTAGLDADIARFLRQTAMEAVKAYLSP